MVPHSSESDKGSRSSDLRMSLAVTEEKRSIVAHYTVCSPHRALCGVGVALHIQHVQYPLTR